MVVGIDPGVTGAVAVLYGDHLSVQDTPTFTLQKTRKDYDVQGMVNLLLRAPSDAHIFIERQQAMPKQGVSSTFKIGFGYGLWLGIISALGRAFTVVSPQTWQKEMYAGVSGEGKERSFVAAQRLFPMVALGGKSYRGRADALLIAEYGRRRQSA